MSDDKRGLYSVSANLNVSQLYRNTHCGEVGVFAKRALFYSSGHSSSTMVDSSWEIVLTVGPACFSKSKTSQSHCFGAGALGDNFTKERILLAEPSVRATTNAIKQSRRRQLVKGNQHL